jgi:hypothetical protein
MPPLAWAFLLSNRIQADILRAEWGADVVRQTPSVRFDKMTFIAAGM